MTESDAVRKYLFGCHCLKSVRIRSFSGSYFPAFGLNMEDTEYLSIFSPKAGEHGRF